MEHRKFIVGGLIALGAVVLVVAGILYNASNKSKQADQDLSDQEVAAADPVDIVLDFYNPWLEAVKSTSTDPYASELASEKILSKELRALLVSKKERAETEIDPVLCQTTTPERVTGRVVSEQENVVRVLVMAKEKELTAQSVFTLKRHNNGWYIDSILCSPGEFELPREFSFEKEGHLLKSVPPPLDPQYWHIVFEEDGVPGHAVPLLFDADSSCVSLDGSQYVCTPDQFTDATKVHVYGQMTELGVEVTRLEFIE